MIDQLLEHSSQGCMGLPQSTHRVYTKWLSSDHTSLREDLASRWPNFFQSLLNGPSPEVAVIARMAAAYAHSATASNNRFIFNCTGKHVLEATASLVRVGLRQQEPQMTDGEIKAAKFLTKALEYRTRLIDNGQDITLITQQINQASSG